MSPALFTVGDCRVARYWSYVFTAPHRSVTLDFLYRQGAIMRIKRLGLIAALFAGACSGTIGHGNNGVSALSVGDARYLALGDSIAFGFNPHLPYAPPFAGFIGYPEDTAAGDGLPLANAACPGETSGSFLDATQPDNGCHSAQRYFAQGLKVDYQGATAQMDYALAFLKTHRPELITIDIGGNDLLLVQAACGNDVVCIAEKLPVALATFAGNLGRILGELRGAGYFGRIVVLTQYAMSYTDLQQVTALSSLAGEVHAVAPLFDARVADGYGAFAAAALPALGDACAAGLLIRNGDGTCDKHPSAAGQQLLADTVLVAAF
jgi:lysophospholipase L1-like esterase